MADYAKTAYLYAKANSFTSTQIKNASYAAIATAAGVTLGGGGESPDDFFYRHVQRQVFVRLKQEEDDATSEARRIAARAKIRELVQWADAEVEFVPEGETTEGPCWAIRRSD